MVAVWVRCVGMIAAMIGGFSVGAVSAADIPAPASWGARAPVVVETALYRPEAWEVRGGAFAQCCFVETGVNLGGEVVVPRFWIIPVIPEFFTPRLHAGFQASLNGHTSYGYAGLLWTINFFQRFFVEPFVGVAFSDGVALGDANHNAIGCTTLIHSGGNIGVRLDRHWSVMLTLDHISNGNLCSRNVGVNNYGAKVGYAF
jgi:hypothetical protein